MDKEVFAKPCVGAIIERTVDGKRCILVQTRLKPDGGDTNGLLEIPAGKVREYEDMFSALRREVGEETGLRAVNIRGEEQCVQYSAGGITVISAEPFCVTQNLSGAYSIVLNTFVCEAEGEALAETDETTDIRWIALGELKEILVKRPGEVFFMHINALRKYLSLKSV